MFPNDGGNVVDGLADLPEVPTVPHIAPDKHTEEGDVQTKDGRLRERLYPQHVQDAGEEVTHGHDCHQHSRRAVGIHYVFALISLEEGLVSLQYPFLEALLESGTESLSAHLPGVGELFQAELSQFPVLRFQPFRREVGSLSSTQLVRDRVSSKGLVDSD